MRKLLLLLDFARSRSAFLSLGEPAMGALIASGGIPSARVVFLGLLAALAGYLCVYALNDLLDLEADRQEIAIAARDPRGRDSEAPQLDIMTMRHPIAAGALPVWTGVTWVSVLGVVGLVAAYMLRPICAWLFVGCALLQVLYCCLRRRTWLKILPAGVMVSLGGLAGWFAVGGAGWGALAFFFLLLFWEIAGRNLSNDLADVEHDRLVGIATLAATHGEAAAIRAITAGALCMPLLGALQAGPWVARLILAAVAVATMTIPALLLAHDGTSRASQRYFNRASLFPAVGAGCLVVLDLAQRPF